VGKPRRTHSGAKEIDLAHGIMPAVDGDAKRFVHDALHSVRTVVPGSRVIRLMPAPENRWYVRPEQDPQ